MELVFDCARNSLSYEHYNINHRLKKAIRFQKLDLPKLLNKLHAPDSRVLEDDDNNVRAMKISDFIYRCCKDSYTRCRPNGMTLTDNLLNCSSSNFKAIAEVNLFAHQSQSRNGFDTTQYIEN